MKRHIKFTHMMKVAQHEQLVKGIQRTAQQDKMSKNQLNCHVEYSRAFHALEQRMQMCQKRNPIMIATDKDKDNQHQVDENIDENIDPLSVQEMKEFKIFEVYRAVSTHDDGEVDFTSD